MSIPITSNGGLEMKQKTTMDSKVISNEIKVRNYRKFTFTLLVSTLSVLALLATSCGGSDDATSNVAETSSSSETSETEESSSSQSTNEETAEEDTTSQAPEIDEDCSTASEARDDLFPGVMFFSEAQTRCITDIDWGDRCDEETGRLKIPVIGNPECFAPFVGDNGGATAQGVTEDTINIVYWRWQENDFILQYITGPIANDDTNADAEASLRGLIQYYETYYETYGRKVNLIFYEGTGNIADPISARADAVKIAEEYDPFMVWNGPTLTNAFEDELVSRGIACLGCGPSQQVDYYKENDPLSWTFSMSGEQNILMGVEYVTKQLAGKNAEYAGDENYHNQERVFGRLFIESGEASVENNNEFENQLAQNGVEIAETVAYALDPATLQESAASAISKFKAAGVTSILLSSDPIAPRDFTREATAQGYFPEWVHIGSVLADTTVFARTYDQDQWANAFGITTLSVRTNPLKSGAPYRYKWFFGEPAPADDSIAVIDPWPATFYPIIQGIGPDLTYDKWREGLNIADPTERYTTASSFSWGEKGRWPAELEYDFFGNDEVTVFWWDSGAQGLDETDAEGSGMYQYADEGQRYLWGEIPEAEIELFNPATSIDLYDDLPPGQEIPNYEPIQPGG